MPFENLSPDPANAFFADGLHEEILATLSQRAPDLQVISRTTMMRYRAHPAPLPQIAAELNRSGSRTRSGAEWTQLKVFQLLPRVIEIGPEILSQREWSESKKRLLAAVS